MTRTSADPTGSTPPGAGTAVPQAVVEDALREWAARAGRLPQVTAVRAVVELHDQPDAIEVTTDGAAFAVADGAPRTTRTRWGRQVPAAALQRHRTLSAPGGEAIGDLQVELLTVGGEAQCLLADVLTDGLTGSIRMRLADRDERSRSDHLSGVMRESSLATATLDALIDESVVAVGLVSLELATLGHVTRANHRLQRLCGRTATELTTTSYLDLLEGPQRGVQEAGLRRAVNGRLAPFRSDGPIRRRGAAGPHVRVTTTPVLTEGGPPTVATLQLVVVDASDALTGAGGVEPLDEPAGSTGVVDPTRFADVVAEAQDRAARTRQDTAMFVARVEGLDDLVRERGPAAAADVQRFVAERLRSALRADDVIGRVSEHELAFVAEEIDVGQAELLAQRLGRALSLTYEVDGRPVLLRLALGTAMMHPRQTGADALDHARRAADRAEAGRAGPGPAGSDGGVRVHVDPTPAVLALAEDQARAPRFYPRRRRRSG
ncbi:sensor domain-containing diguanylate cyclase [Lapillicoccus jejuensis]|uniref:GGDEF domain-containing protein n=1 Tax=Lapillicoccus jejuensis TaxID=402171 RepID=A0A542DZT9_9MICO|nr:GGDEF domain-containing protein [Lapillicoccus jejuensis]TQJ08617.1 GGDEF domain-containing protein [Lapillicoccus jejuensis]